VTISDETQAAEFIQTLFLIIGSNDKIEPEQRMRGGVGFNSFSRL